MLLKGADHHDIQASCSFIIKKGHSIWKKTCMDDCGIFFVYIQDTLSDWLTQ